MSAFPCLQPPTGEQCRVVQIPGPPGQDGAPCIPCNDGANAYGSLIAGFTMPAIAGTVIAEVDSTAWMVPQEGTVYGQTLAVQFAGTLFVASIIDSTHVELYNPGYTGNAIAGSAIPAGARVGVSGSQGLTGAVPGGALLSPNNLSDVSDTSASRSNLGLGALATLNTVNNGDWSGTPLAVANGGTGSASAAAARTALGLALGTDVQAYNALLAGLVAAGPGAADQLAYLTAANTWALTSLTAAMRTLLASATNAALLAALKTFPRAGLLGSLASADMNSVLDQAISISSTKYRVTGILATNASINLTTAQGGVYNAVGKPGGGILVAAGQAYTALTAAAKYVDLTLTGVAVTDVQTAAFLYLSLTTPQGAAATADIYIFGEDLT